MADEDNVSRYSCRRQSIIQGMIIVPRTGWPAATAPPFTRRGSAAGLFDRLPVELIQLVFEQLDVKSLVKLSSTSVGAHKLVRSLPSFLALTKHAPLALAALSKTRMLDVHPVSKLYAALQTSLCVSCGNFGAFLFLPTCDRCCRLCLGLNRSLQVVPEFYARKCFALSRDQMETVPTLLTRLGTYCVRMYKNHKRRERLVSTKTVKERSLQVHGSLANVQKAANMHNISAGVTGVQTPTYYYYMVLYSAPLEPPSEAYDAATLPSTPIGYNDSFGGVASVAFPWLDPKTDRLEGGLWCRGCQKILEKWSSDGTDRLVLESTVPRSLIPSSYFHARWNQERSTSGMAEHMEECVGIRILRHEEQSPER